MEIERIKEDRIEGRTNKKGVEKNQNKIKGIELDS